jgi:hypothetical protein
LLIERSKEKGFDEYAILSMAQTRAIGKTYRNVIGFVMKTAGYEARPAEEMTRGGEAPAVVPKVSPDLPESDGAELFATASRTPAAGRISPGWNTTIQKRCTAAHVIRSFALCSAVGERLRQLPANHSLGYEVNQSST